MKSGSTQPFTSDTVARRGGGASKSAPTLFDLEPVATARRTDPETSREAARSVQNIAQAQEDVLALLKRGPATDEELKARHDSAVSLGAMKRQSPSGLRTRRAELVERGLIVSDGRTRRTTAGRNSLVWRLAPCAGDSGSL